MSDAATVKTPGTDDGHRSNNQNPRRYRRTSNIRTLAAGIFGACAVVLTAQSSRADFGAAEVGGKNNEARTFEAWCARKGNNCKVSFDINGITIDENNSVPYNRIKTFYYGANNGVCNAYGFWCIGRAYTFDIVYSKDDGTEGVGKIIFAKQEIALTFMFNLKTVTGNKPWGGDPRCNSGEVFQEGICLSPTTAAEVRTREKESVNASNAVIEHGRAIGTGLAIQGELQREGLESKGRSIQKGLGNIRVEKNTGVILMPR